MFFFFQPKELLDGDKSDSDYGDDDWQGAGGWDDSEMDDGWDDKGGLVDFGVTTEKEITKQVYCKTQLLLRFFFVFSFELSFTIFFFFINFNFHNLPLSYTQGFF